ncbi:MAG: hypothetical protein B7Y39_16490 [Bdellovibrio sp. 28-41-41]|nr:MAG: hypothetical protein B7Y39_16490 [Bdellovibrio sp. 28-41-41]
MDRRKFLKNSLKSATTLTLPLGLLSVTGCAALDRYFEIEKSDYAKEVLIFGGGVSGLSAAYFLKKNGIPYRVFEGSGRMGGRVLSQRFPAPVRSIDLGARYVDSMDQYAIELIKEMNVDLEEAPIQKNAYFFCMNKDVMSYKSILANYSPTIKAWNKELARIRKLTDQLTNEPYNEEIMGQLTSYDKISFSDIVNDSKLDFKGRSIFKSWAEMHFQKKATEISFLEWLYHFEKLILSSKRMYLPNGMAQFVDILSQRVSGVIPNYSMQQDSKLVEISRQQERWVCHIQTKDGLKKLSSPFVILALPFNQIKDIKGIDQVFTNKDFKNAIQQAQFKSNYRLFYKTTQKSSKENGEYNFFETHRFKVTKEDYVYTLDLDAPVEANEVNVMKSQMSAVFGLKDFDEINSYSWTEHPKVNGSELKLNGNALLSIKKAYLENWDRMTLQLVGDYLISPGGANLNDCIRTARRASKILMTQVLEKEWT